MKTIKTISYIILGLIQEPPVLMFLFIAACYVLNYNECFICNIKH